MAYLAFSDEASGQPDTTRCSEQSEERFADEIASLARHCLNLEVDTYPKPGLVSHCDRGSHRDMDAALLHSSAASLQPFFTEFFHAGHRNAEMSRLRKIGIEAEASMLSCTGGINTHRGAIFGLGLLVAAAGLRQATGTTDTLGALVARRWGKDILQGPVNPHSHGGVVLRQYGVGGARAQAAQGFPAIYGLGLPALREGLSLAKGRAHDARVHLCFCLIAELDDTNLLHRGGQPGLDFARLQARHFLLSGSIDATDWITTATAIHQQFVARNLSPGGAADLLGMTLFVHELERPSSTPFRPNSTAEGQTC